MAIEFAHSEHDFNRFVRCQRDDNAPAFSHPANMMGDGQNFGENLKAARVALGWSQDRLAAEAETSKGYISDLERNLRPIPPGKKLQALASALGVPLAQLVQLDDLAAPPERRTVPVVGYVGAGAVAHLYGDGQGELDRVPAPLRSTDATVAAEIRGTSLGPLFESWLVYWDEVRNPVTPDLHGELCVVGLAENQVLVKKIQAAGAPGRFHLLSNFGEEPLFDREVLWAAKVTSMSPR